HSDPPQELALGEDAEVLPHRQGPRADQPDHDHPGQRVAAAALEAALVLLEQPEADARRGDDAQDGEDTVPRDEEWADANDVWVEVDDDRECCQAARSRRLSASSFGSSANA